MNSDRRTRVIVLSAATLLCAAALLLSHPNTSSRLDSIFASEIASQSPGCAAVVRKGGETVFQRAYGLRDLQARVPNDAKTDFRLASVTKQFTAMAVMMLVHDGKLRYDESLAEILPEFPAYGRLITVRHLLTHTSGLPDYEDLMEAAEKSGHAKWTAEHQITDREVLELLERESAGKFSPGTKWSYSNSGFVVLGLTVAKLSGMPFARFLHERIFKPLGMNDTLAYIKGENSVPNRAYGYRKEGGVFVPSDQSSTSATLGDGGVYSNLLDLAKWDDALAKNTLLSAQEMQAAITPAKLNGGGQTMWPVEANDDNLAPGKPVSYGFGWFLDRWRDRERMWHFGTTSGFRTAIERFPSDEVTVIVLCNRTDLDPGKMALDAANVVLGK